MSKIRALAAAGAIRSKSQLQHSACVQQRLVTLVEKALLDACAELGEIKELHAAKRLAAKNVDIDRLLHNRIERASVEAAKALMGEDFEPRHLPLPSKARVKWCDRKSKDDLTTNPIDFLERYWGSYINAGVLDQRTLHKLDDSLMPAIRVFCRNRRIEAHPYLPPPTRIHARGPRKKLTPETPAQPIRPKAVSKRSGAQKQQVAGAAHP